MQRLRIVLDVFTVQINLKPEVSLTAVLHQLDKLPTTEPVILLGDFNAHLGGHKGLADTP